MRGRESDGGGERERERERMKEQEKERGREEVKGGGWGGWRECDKKERESVTA